MAAPAASRMPFRQLQILADVDPTACILDTGVQMDITCSFSRLATDAERLMVLDVIDDSEADAASGYVDDLKMPFSSPWSLSLGTPALDKAARHYGVVYECGGCGSSLLFPRAFA